MASSQRIIVFWLIPSGRYLSAIDTLPASFQHVPCSIGQIAGWVEVVNDLDCLLRPAPSGIHMTTPCRD